MLQVLVTQPNIKSEHDIRLEALYPALWETCEEFGESYPFQTLHNMVDGCHKQLAREEPRTLGAT